MKSSRLVGQEMHERLLSLLQIPFRMNHKDGAGFLKRGNHMRRLSPKRSDGRRSVDLFDPGFQKKGLFKIGPNGFAHREKFRIKERLLKTHPAPDGGVNVFIKTSEHRGRVSRQTKYERGVLFPKVNRFTRFLADFPKNTLNPQLA